jgi:hypothetical protein
MAAEDYRAKAAELDAKASVESDPFARAELHRLAESYRRLADQADRNSLTDVVYEPAPLSGQAERAAQQQQQQPQPKPDKE